MVLQLNGAQVNQLIAIHETTRTQQRALADEMRGLFPHQTGQRQAPSTAQRDSLRSLFDAMRTVRWRAMSDADSVLTPAQRQAASRLAMSVRWRMGMGRARGGATGGAMNRVRGGFQFRAPRGGRQPDGAASGADSGT